MATLKIKPLNAVIEINKDTSVREALELAGYNLSDDGIVKLVAGEEFTNTPTFEELAIMGNVYHVTKERLADHMFVTEDGEVVIDITNHLATDKSEPEVQTRVRKKEAVKEMYDERAQKRLERNEERKLKQSVKPWEQDKSDPKAFKKLGGNRRPRAFKYNKDGESN